MSKNALVQELNAEQLSAVTHTEGPLLVVAGAGTGKTTVITRRIAWLMEEKLAKPSEILALTFTDKAAAEMEARVDILVPFGYTDMWILTFHALGERLLRHHAVDLGISSDFTVMSQVEQAIFLRRHLWQFNLDYYRPLANPTKHIEALIQFFSRLKDENTNPNQLAERVEQYLSTTEFETQEIEDIETIRWKELVGAYKTYEELLRQEDKLDFGDLLSLTIKLLKERPQIRKIYQDRFNYILVDEFQDTNHAQHELLTLLTNKNQNLTVVGDDDQAIYAFRGAALDNILEFRDTYRGTKTVVLNHNYRSSQSILDASYELITHNNPYRLEAKYNLSKKLVGRPGGHAPSLFYESSGSEEVDRVVGIIRERARAGLNYRDFAILGRSHSHLAPFEQALIKAGLPVVAHDRGLYEQPEIASFINFLKVIAYPTDSVALAFLMSSELYGIEPQLAANINHLSKRRNRPINYLLGSLDELAGEVDIDETAKGKLQQITTDIETYTSMATKHNVGEVLYDFLREHGVIRELSQPGEGNELRIRQVVAFFNRITRYIQTSNEQSVTAFIDNLELLREFGDDPRLADPDPDINAVHLLTTHASKGLEFPVVFVVNCIVDRFPSRNRRDAIEIPNSLLSPNSSGKVATESSSEKSIAEEGSERKADRSLPSAEPSFSEEDSGASSNPHLAEERRLFYVAMTRAKQELILTLAADYGGSRVRKASPFLLEALGLEQLPPPISKTRLDEQLSLFAPPPTTLPTIRKESAISPYESDGKTLILTASKIEDYLDCPAKYRALHILHLPIVQSHAMVYGVAIHKAIQQFYTARQDKQEASYDILRDAFTKTWFSEGFLSREHEDQRYQAGLITLRRFFEDDRHQPRNPIAIEESFRFPYSRTNDVILSGRFDCIYQLDDGGVEITDFKTSNVTEQKAALKRAKDSLQLLIYAMAYQSANQKLPELVSLQFVESGLLGAYQPTEKALAKAYQQIDETIEGIRSGYFGKGKGSHTCEWCSGTS